MIINKKFSSLSRDQIRIKHDKFNYYLELLDKIFVSDSETNNSKNYSFEYVNYILTMRCTMSEDPIYLQNSVDLDVKEFIYSTYLYLGKLNKNILLKNIEASYLKSNVELFVVFVTMNNTYDDNDTYNYNYTKTSYHIENSNNKIDIIEISLYNLFNNLFDINSNKEFYSFFFKSKVPIFIFSGISLTTIKYLFNCTELKLNSGSITLRNRLDLVEHTLSKFLYVSDLDINSKAISWNLYREKIFSETSINLNLIHELIGNDVNIETRNKLIQNLLGGNLEESLILLQTRYPFYLEYVLNNYMFSMNLIYKKYIKYINHTNNHIDYLANRFPSKLVVNNTLVNKLFPIFNQISSLNYLNLNLLKNKSKYIIESVRLDIITLKKLYKLSDLELEYYMLQYKLNTLNLLKEKHEESLSYLDKIFETINDKSERKKYCYSSIY